MCSGRRMSSPWTMISIILVMVGCGGETVLGIADRKADRVCEGSCRRPAATCLSTMRPELHPASRNSLANRGSDSVAVAAKWVTTSWTFHPPHNDGFAHCSGVRPARSSTSAARSVWMTRHRSDRTALVWLIYICAARAARAPRMRLGPAGKSIGAYVEGIGVEAEGSAGDPKSLGNNRKRPALT